MFRVGDIVQAQVSCNPFKMQETKDANHLTLSGVARWGPQHGMGPLKDN